MSAPGIDEQIAEISREIGFRERLYPRWVAEGRLKVDRADAQLAALRAARATLERVRGPLPEQASLL